MLDSCKQLQVANRQSTHSSSLVTIQESLDEVYHEAATSKHW